MPKLIATVCLFIFIALPVGAQTNSKFQSISEQLASDAQSALSNGQLKRARLQFEKALVANPANVTALIGLGETYEKTGNTGKGLKYYRQALEIEPNDHVALKSQALAFIKRDMANRAQDNQEKLTRLCPKGCQALTDVTNALDAYLAEAESAANTSIESDTAPQS